MLENHYKEKINFYFEHVKVKIAKNDYSYKNSLLEGVELIISIHNQSVSKENLIKYITNYYLDFCENEVEFNIEFDDFIVDFLADIKGPPWSKYLNIWDSNITYEEYKEYINGIS